MRDFTQLFDELIEEKSESAFKLNESIKAAQKCLTHGDFHKYKEAYESAYDNILNDMCVFTDAYIFKGQGSIEMYAMKMVQYMQRIQDLRVLLNKVQADANKPLSQTEENKDEKA